MIKQNVSPLTNTLIPLLPESPQELLAECTERGLPKELGHKLVSIRVMRPLVLDGSSSL